jgi:chemotaxis protein MotB
MKYILFPLSITLFLFSCVSQKKYDELLKEKVALSAYERTIQDQLDDANRELGKANAAAKTTGAENQTLKAKLAEMNDTNTQLQGLFDELEKTNNRLKEDYKNLLESSSAKSSELSKNLAEKEKALLDLEQSLLESQKKMDTLLIGLQARERKVKELQGILNQKDSSVQAMKNSISQALLAFEGSDLNVEVKNGKVYVSMASKLLFKTGSVKVDAKGEEALKKLAGVIKDQKDFEIMVEGHTDDVPISKSSKYMQDNWDLSVLRATAVTRILRNGGIQADRISPAGRGPFHPVEIGSSPEVRQKNRRTEIILTPNLDELYEVIQADQN